MSRLSDGLAREALTFDDVLLKPGLSDVLPSEVDIRTRLTRTVFLNLPVLSAAMDTVTEARLAIAMAQAGGIGVIHRNLAPEDQAEHVRRVKKFEFGMVVNPVTIAPDATLADALDLMEQHSISGIPVVERKGNGRNGKLVGILTHRDVRFATNQVSARLRADDQGQAHHRARGGERGRGEEAPAPAPHREIAGGGQGLSLRRPRHRQGHREGGDESERLQGRAGTAARRRRHDRGRRRLRAHRAADRRRRRCGGGRYRARPFPARARGGQPRQAHLQCGAGASPATSRRAKAPRR